jgi:hypothetical protein
VPSWSREIAGDACNAFGAGDPPGREPVSYTRFAGSIGSVVVSLTLRAYIAAFISMKIFY